MSGIEHRLQLFIPPTDQRCLMVDTSAGLALGALPGLGNYIQAVRPILSRSDGVVCSPGQIGKLGELHKEDAGLLVRMDWTNTLRDKNFVIPVTKPQRIPILTPEEAVNLGAAGMVTTFLLGYEEELEASCMLSTVQLALRGKDLGMPLVVEVRTSGPRVSIPDKAVELGASYALEGGADVIALPYPGRKSLETIGAFVSVPWLVKPTSLATAQTELEEALGLGCSGLWLEASVFEQPDPSIFDKLMGTLHPAPVQMSEV